MKRVDLKWGRIEAKRPFRRLLQLSKQEMVVAGTGMVAVRIEKEIRIRVDIM